MMGRTYIAKAGRFNVEGHFGWAELENLIDSSKLGTVQEFHIGRFKYLGAIGGLRTMISGFPE
jgi:hypothetical protein